jgi:hypothetical protein
MWCNRVSHVKDVWAMYLDLVGRITVQCMSALYRLQALQSDAMAHLERGCALGPFLSILGI